MNIPPVKRELNTNTIIQLVTFVILLGGMVWTTAQRDADLTTLRRDFTEYRVAHDQVHKDRLATVSGIEARTDARLSALEVAIRKLDNLEYRVTVVEQGSANLGKAVEELKAAVNNQSADLRVIREILTRQDTRPQN